MIVGSRQFDLVDLIEEELLLSLPLVPKHDICPSVHESLVSGVSGPATDTEDFDEEPEGGDVPGEERTHPFKAIEALKRDGDKKH
ncbi:MAG: hypothetical protein GAK41_00147 [Burkholderia gladioli]|nr:MAG: hypothetical protein GAK41_00147 [Burkholderia gladioli]